MEEDFEQHSAQHDFNLDAFLICDTSIPEAFGPFLEPHRHCAPHALCHLSLYTLTNGLECFALSCWQMPDKCHMQSPSSSALHGGGWQLSLCFCPV